MQTIPLHDFQYSGAAALKHPDQPTMLVGSDCLFALFPVNEDTRDELMQHLDELHAWVSLRRAQKKVAEA